MPPSPTLMVTHMTSYSTEPGTEYTPRRRTISAPLQRALQIRVSALVAQQREAAEEIEWLYRRSDELLYAMHERQQRLREFRHILLNRVAA